MSLTLKQLAEYLNLSIGTISRALKDDPRIAAPTRFKVKELAQKLNYIPSNLGRSLQAKKSFLIGYLVTNFKDSFYNEILQGIAHAAKLQGYGLLIGLTEDNPESELKQLRFFQEKSVDGIIISNYSPETVSALRKVQESGLPLVICDFESFDPAIPTIILNEIKALELLVDYLTGLNHEQFGFYYNVTANSLKRYTIMSDLLHQKGLPKPYLCSNKDHLTEIMSSPKAATALVCYSDFFAIEAIQQLHEMGFKVPEDVSVTGFDDLLYASWPEYQLTTIFQPKMAIGEMSAEKIICLINGEQPCNPQQIEPRLIIRKSCTQLQK